MWPNISLSLLAVGEGQLSTPGWEVAVGERVGGVKGWVGVCWERGGSGEEGWGEALAFSSGIFLSVVLSFPFFLLLFFNPPFSFHGWRHGYQASLGTDNMVQTMVSSPRWWWRGRDTERERGSETERGRPGQGHRGREGQNGALVFRARTLYSITLLSLLQTHILLFLQHTHTHTHTTLISPLLNEVQRHLHCKQHCSLKLETSCYRPATRTWSLKTVRSSIITKRKPINILINRNKQQRKTRVWFSGSCRFTIKRRSYVYKKRKKKNHKSLKSVQIDPTMGELLLPDRNSWLIWTIHPISGVYLRG